VKPASDHSLVNETRPDVSPTAGRPSGGQAASSNRARFQRWTETLRPRLVRLACRYVWNAHDAEEIVQDAVTLAWCELGLKMPETELPDTWLFRATVNLSLNRLRRSRAGPLPPGETATTAMAPHARPEMDELMQRVRLAVRELPDRQQAAIVLRDIEGLPYEQIGTVLEMSPVATRVLVHRAREAVRRILLARWPDSFDANQ